MSRVVVLVTLVGLLAGCSMFGGDGDESPSDVVSVQPSPSASSRSEPAVVGASETDPEPVASESSERESRWDATPEEIVELGPAAFCDLLNSVAEPDQDFCADSDGNFYPDFVEVGVGMDPEIDDCEAGISCTADIDLSHAERLARQNVLIVLDVSGSMAGQVGGRSKMEVAKGVLIDYVRATPAFVDQGLLVYGHRGDNTDAGKAESCSGIELLAEIGELTGDSVEGVVGSLTPTGWTPLAASLDLAVEAFADAVETDRGEGIEDAPNRVVVISDGIETCDGDPVRSAQALAEAGYEVVVDVVGFDLGEADRAALEEVAAVTGGMYSDAGSAGELRSALGAYLEENERVYEAINCLTAEGAEQALCRGARQGDLAGYLGDLLHEWVVSDDPKYDDAVWLLINWKNAVGTLNHRQAGGFQEEDLAPLEDLRAMAEEVEGLREDYLQTQEE